MEKVNLPARGIAHFLRNMARVARTADGAGTAVGSPNKSPPRFKGSRPSAA